jgi:hypothetical protein
MQQRVDKDSVERSDVLAMAQPLPLDRSGSLILCYFTPQPGLIADSRASLKIRDDKGH